jgi:hypothetical protein
MWGYSWLGALPDGNSGRRPIRDSYWVVKGYLEEHRWRRRHPRGIRPRACALWRT